MNKIEKKYPRNFLEAYKKNIAPKLQQIDINLKTCTYPITVSETSKMLYITEDEVKNIMKSENITEINKLTFFSIMINGSSYICKIFKREVECGSPYFYSSKDISYIYNIDKDMVEDACNFLGITKITSSTLPSIFAQIQL